jgi:hypothetical protein
MSKYRKSGCGGEIFIRWMSHVSHILRQICDRYVTAKRGSSESQVGDSMPVGFTCTCIYLTCQRYRFHRYLPVPVPVLHPNIGTMLCIYPILSSIFCYHIHSPLHLKQQVSSSSIHYTAISRSGQHSFPFVPMHPQFWLFH